ncbi:hypothetical protein RI367_001577 [Sorochytrium milnesiophthora]
MPQSWQAAARKRRRQRNQGAADQPQDDVFVDPHGSSNSSDAAAANAESDATPGEQTSAARASGRHGGAGLAGEETSEFGNTEAVSAAAAAAAAATATPAAKDDSSEDDSNGDDDTMTPLVLRAHASSSALSLPGLDAANVSSSELTAQDAGARRTRHATSPLVSYAVRAVDVHVHSRSATSDNSDADGVSRSMLPTSPSSLPVTPGATAVDCDGKQLTRQSASLADLGDSLASPQTSPLLPTSPAEAASDDTLNLHSAYARDKQDQDKQRVQLLEKRVSSKNVLEHSQAGDDSNINSDVFPSRLGKRTPFRLYNIADVPHFLQDNEFIHTGYRAYYTFRESWLSMLRVHNETGNIWTHLLGFLLFTALLIATLTVPNTAVGGAADLQAWWHWGVLPAQADLYDRLIFAVFLASACGCFAFSTLFHTHFCTTRQAFIRFGCLDYAGISLLISGSAAIVTYYAFYCPHDHHTRLLYLGLLVLVSLVGIVGPIVPVWATARFRIYRTLIYLGSGVIAAMPIMHFLAYYGMPALKAAAADLAQLPSTPGLVDNGVGWWGLYGWLVMIGLYIGGAFIYASKIPERWAPGRFDLLLHSHQIWHVCVVAAAVAHYWSARALLVWRLETGPASCPVR